MLRAGCLFLVFLVAAFGQKVSPPNFGPPSGGTVTSVSGPSWLTWANPTTTPTATVASQTANTALIAPDGSAGAATFRLLVIGDLPAIPLTHLSTETADTVVMNASGVTASPTAVPMPTGGTNGCAGANNATTYNTSTHAWGCNTLSGGSVSSIATTAPITGGTITTTGTIGCSTCATGPASAASGNLPSFNGTGGKTLQDSGIAASSVTLTIASGQTAMPTGALGANACSASATTAAATGALTTDAAEVIYASDPTGVTGYGGGTSGGITIRPWITANTMNFKLCNETAGSITPGALNVNWRIAR